MDQDKKTGRNYPSSWSAAWRRPRRGRSGLLDPYAPDPEWMIRARDEVEEMHRRANIIRIHPRDWDRHKFEDYAPFVFHLNRAVQRELKTDLSVREITVQRNPKGRKRVDWIFRIEIVAEAAGDLSPRSGQPRKAQYESSSAGAGTSPAVEPAERAAEPQNLTPKGVTLNAVAGGESDLTTNNTNTPDTNKTNKQAKPGPRPPAPGPRPPVPREFKVVGVVDPGDYYTKPFFRELEVSFVTRQKIPGPLREKNGELVSRGDWCVLLNEWKTVGSSQRNVIGNRGPLRGALIEQPPGSLRSQPSLSKEGSSEQSAGCLPLTAHGSLLDLPHKFIPPPNWWQGYCSPFKFPYCLWFAPEPLKPWLEKRLYHPTSTEWPWLPDGPARDRQKVANGNFWTNRKGYWTRDGKMENGEWIIRQGKSWPRRTGARDEKGRWQKPYTGTTLWVRRQKKSIPRPKTPLGVGPVKPKPDGSPVWVHLTPETRDSFTPIYMTKKALREPGPWPKWKLKKMLKAPPRRGRPREVEDCAVYYRYRRAQPSLKIAPLRPGACKYQVNARLIPLGENLHLAELFEFDAELKRALKSNLKAFRTMPKTKRVAMRDKVRSAQLIIDNG
jgi:hypothetical protein